KPLTILCVGDLFGEPGRRAAETLVPKLRKQYDVDLAIVNVENAAAGYGVTPQIARSMLEHGADVMTTGNHVWDRKEIIEYIVKENLLLRPANYPVGTPGAGSVVVKAGPHKVAVLNLMGRVFFPQNLDCPFRKADEEIARLRQETPIIVVDAHCEATSESQALGGYLDGQVVPRGTAFITDRGMAGPVSSVMGVEPELAIGRFLTQMPGRFEPAKGPSALHGAVIRVDPDTGKALGIERISAPAPALS